MKTSDYPSLLWRRGDTSMTTRLVVELAAPLDEVTAEQIESAIDTFCRASDLGGFCERSVRPGECACRRVSSERLQAAMRFELACKGIDYRAFQVLRNMLAKLQEQGVRTRELAVFGTQRSLPEDPIAPLIDEDNEELAYPPLHDAASLSFADENDASASWLRRCVVSVRVPVEQSHVDALRSLANPWFDVLEAGGFAMPLDFPWDVESVGDTVTQFEECSMEVTVLRFQASEEAWSVLANLIHMNASALGLDLERVVVDE
jgi:hypothetical protein